jgi:tRNA A58 N-methylase Trm61
MVLSKSAGRVFGVEKNQIVDKAKDNLKKFENVTIIHEDAQNIYRIFEKVGPVSMIFIDIGGNALPWRTVSFAEKYMRMFSPKVIVLRNHKLSEFISSLEYCEKRDTGRWSIQCKVSDGLNAEQNVDSTRIR